MPKLMVALIVVLMFACGAPIDKQEVTPNYSDDPVYEDVTASSGVSMVHFNGATGSYLFPEIIGSGGALFDYDNDGDLDLFAAQGAMLESKPLSQALFPPDSQPHDRLFRNDTKPGGSIIFTDVSQESGLADAQNAMGVAVGDIDNDGDVDLYVTRFGAGSLFRNNGDGTFEDITEVSGAGNPDWGVSASFTDFDGDGFLDLYIGNYCDYAVETNKACHQPELDYCNPITYPAAPDRLLRNRGDGTFDDVSEASGITKAFGRALGVIAADFNGDNWVDIYVANDGSVNQFWVNRGDGTFVDDALLAGNGLNEAGMPEAGMGVDAADVNGDGHQDLFVTHLMGETNTIYINKGEGIFEDQTPRLGLGGPSHPFTGFGAAFTDYDNDGDPDLFVVNGSVTRLENATDPSYPFDQPNQLYANESGSFSDVTATAGAIFFKSEVSRGAAFGDLDNDGDEDAVIFNNSGPLRILANRYGQRNSWIGLRLIGEHGRDAIGARVILKILINVFG